jgi:hypothetical protein
VTLRLPARSLRARAVRDSRRAPGSEASAARSSPRSHSSTYARVLAPSTGNAAHRAGRPGLQLASELLSGLSPASGPSHHLNYASRTLIRVRRPAATGAIIGCQRSIATCRSTRRLSALLRPLARRTNPRRLPVARGREAAGSFKFSVGTIFKFRREVTMIVSLASCSDNGVIMYACGS